MSKLTVIYAADSLNIKEEITADFESIEIDFIKKEVAIHNEIFEESPDLKFSDLSRIEIRENENKKSTVTIEHEFGEIIQTTDFECLIIDFESETVQMFQDYEEDEQQFELYKLIKVTN